MPKLDDNTRSDISKGKKHTQKLERKETTEFPSLKLSWVQVVIIRVNCNKKFTRKSSSIQIWVSCNRSQLPTAPPYGEIHSLFDTMFRGLVEKNAQLRGPKKPPDFFHLASAEAGLGAPDWLPAETVGKGPSYWNWMRESSASLELWLIWKMKANFQE